MTKFVKKVWGSELWMVNSKKYCGKILTLKEGYCCSKHYHKLKDETFFIDKGKVKMEVENDIKIMLPGESVHIPPNTLHRFIGLKDSRIIEISTQHFEDDSYRLTKSGKYEC
jgi:quercetin dioxygenase-like cupin family protein